ncbi:MAG: hypothetical protein K2X48_00295 [Chitinophagaceae bacterium]|nr:hypothetical protein [Chitinophagaceae bacterium]
MKKMILMSLIACLFLQAQALRIEYGNNVTITSPVYEDLYIAGGTVTVNAVIHGDLIVAGGTVIINDSVMNDILLAGGNVTLNGFAGDDVRCAGGNIKITKNIAGDLVITGGTVILDKGVSIGSLLVSGGDVTIDGTVTGELKGAVGKLVLNGTVAKDMDCRGGTITVNGSVTGKSVLAAGKIIIGNNASFNNDVRYWNKKRAVDFKQSLKNGKAIYDSSLKIQTGEWFYLGGATVLFLLWYLGMALLMILLVQYLFSATMKKAADTVFTDTAKSLGYGFLYFIGVPVLILVALVTVIGVPVGILLLTGYIFSLLLATVIAAVTASNWVNNRNKYQWSYWKLVFAAFGLFVLLKLVSLLPFAGSVILFVVGCICFGAILLTAKTNFRKEKQTQVQL